MRLFKMKLKNKFNTLMIFNVLIINLCSFVIQSEVRAIENLNRNDGAYQIQISEYGSLQNSAWSPDEKSILFTRFRNAYNEEPADLFIFNLQNGIIKSLVADGSGNINLPGSSWNAKTNKIVFTSTCDPHDEIFIIERNGNPGDENRITNCQNEVAYEPTLSPDGQWIVFESHILDVEENGIVIKYEIDGSSGYQELTSPNEDCRQPNWSPAGDLILYQKLFNGQWDIWVMETDGTNRRKVTIGTGDKTDAAFSPDGKWIVYSSDEGEIEFANLFVISVSGGSTERITNFDGYDGAPSWSPNGDKISFESYPGDPDESQGTTLWVLDLPTKVNKKKNFLLPTKFSLKQNYPNPFNSKTVFQYGLAVSSQVELSIFSIFGQQVETLILEKQVAGNHKVEWSADNLASGVYLYRLTAGGSEEIRKLILIK